MTQAAVDDTWIRSFHPAAGGGANLACFPHAGGSASYFRPMSEALKGALRVSAVQYPGRQDRMHEPNLSSIAELADAAHGALRPLMGEPLAFFGHSMGAVIAFEVAQRMLAAGDRPPLALFVSGRCAPSRFREGTVHLLDDAGLAEHLKRTSGTDPRILEDPGVLEMILPPVRSDYAAIENYRAAPDTPRLDCPVVAFVGKEDRSVDEDEARAWAEHTTGGFSLHSYSGGHFFLDEHLPAISSVIAGGLSPKS